jgi:hypothetical protein
VRPGQIGSYREVKGWEKIRPGGGANQIGMRHETGFLLCSGCGERRKMNARRGIDPGQETLI